MAPLPRQDEVAKAIYRHYEERNEAKGPRPYLGISILGKECRRYLWLTFRWAWRPTPEGRILRLWDHGNHEEARIIADLKNIGIRHEGDQYEVEACGGHMKGHFDGVVLGVPLAEKTWHLFEAKTYNDKRFKALKSKGVKESDPTYYVQMQCYMLLGELTRALFFAVNKNDEQIYTERVKLDKAFAQAQIDKGEQIIFANSPPHRLSDDPSYYLCKWCDMRPVCHEKRVPAVNCRTCAHSTPERDGAWSCRRGLAPIDGEPLFGCEEHIILPPIMDWLTPIDGSQTHVEYEEVVNVAASGFCPADKPQRCSGSLHAATLSAPIHRSLVDVLQEQERESAARAADRLGEEHRSSGMDSPSLGGLSR